jgi:hypothetical protein
MRLKSICVIFLISINIISFSQVNYAFIDRHKDVLIDNNAIVTEKPTNGLNKYREQLKLFRNEFNVQEMPDIKFFLFGMANRSKLIYKKGFLMNSLTGTVLKKWNIKEETIIPNEYKVNLLTVDDIPVSVYENEKGIYINEMGKERLVEGTDYAIVLPSFGDHRYSEILKVLHQELLINVIESKPVPNYFVYQKPWVRDASLMAMCFEQTGNLHVIKNWVLSLDEVYDYNNGEAEGDNLGQTLFLLSLFTDKNNPLVQKVLAEAKKREIVTDKGKYISGRTDGSERPAYDTKWLKFGLKSLGLHDDYVVPDIDDGYNTLVWWDYKDIEDEKASISEHYPYITWAQDHYFGRKNNPISNRDYPLTWEINASAADYPKMAAIDEKYVKDHNASPHTWHAAEIFLYLTDQSVFDSRNNWSFDQHVISDSLFDPDDITCADLNSDGLLDIIFDSKGMTWYENSGSETHWPLHFIFDMGDISDHSRVYDFNGDGRDDIITQAYHGSGTYYLPSPDDPEGRWKSFRIGGKSAGLALYDVDRDGDMDVLNSSVWYENPGNPAQEDWPEHIIPNADPEVKCDAGDINNDGITDFAHAEEEGKECYILLGPGYEKIDLKTDGNGLHTMKLVDLDKDGDLDLITADIHGGNLYIFENANGKGTEWKCHKQKNNSSEGVHICWIGDFNNDGMMDVFGKHYNTGSFVEIWYNTFK